MSVQQILQQQIAEQQDKYQTVLLNRKEFSSLKAIKNSIKKMQRQLFVLENRVDPA